ncbi:MAG: Rrf2 family transcriptional regulator [Candidatus Alcyoniella australis]|nr:Rrf2 family transcriptional regulator [Candidatus Alcyoniella australis]
MIKISAKAEYAVLAVMELAIRKENPEPSKIRDIAKAQGIPEKYLVQILIQLQRADFVRSVRGARGGYNLAMDPNEIKIVDVVAAVDGPIKAPSKRGKQQDKARIMLSSLWDEVYKRTSNCLSDITISTLVAQYQGGEQMYYI